MPRYKLTEAQVREIRDKLDRRDELREELARLTMPALAAQYKVDRSTIIRINNYRNWKGVL